jgi:uncharacterized protein YjdB
MNFKFKLSRRLAIALVLGLGCKLATTGPATGLITGIVVAPSRLSLLPSQAAPLTVVVYSSKTDSAALALAQGTLQWSTTGGSIGNNGLIDGVRYITYTPPAQPGTYLLVVTAANGWPADTASILVTSTPVPVGEVAVSPGSANLAVGDTVVLQATLTDGNGSVILGRPITWTTSDAGVATVLSTGFVRAMTAGTVTITATSEEHAGTATITVSP